MTTKTFDELWLDGAFGVTFGFQQRDTGAPTSVAWDDERQRWLATLDDCCREWLAEDPACESLFKEAQQECRAINGELYGILDPAEVERVLCSRGHRP